MPTCVKQVAPRQASPIRTATPPRVPNPPTKHLFPNTTLSTSFSTPTAAMLPSPPPHALTESYKIPASSYLSPNSDLRPQHQQPVATRAAPPPSSAQAPPLTDPSNGSSTVSPSYTTAGSVRSPRSTSSPSIHARVAVTMSPRFVCNALTCWFCLLAAQLQKYQHPN